MKKIVVLLLFISTVCNAQSEKENYKNVAAIFMSNYNAGKYEAIFNMYDANVKASLPLDKSNAFFKNNVSPAGKMKKMEFWDIKNSAHIYKTTFDNIVLDVLLSLDTENKINGFYIRPHTPKNLPKLERNSTKMSLPFNEEWDVFWGGTKVEDNYHVAYNNQKGAYDLVIRKNGKTHKTDGRTNKDYYVFGKEIIAPVDATVVKIIRGVEDNIPGKMNPAQVTGNTVILKTTNNEFIVLAHFKKQSIKVKRNQKVKKGELLGLCGNSGNSSEPHLHISLQNVEDMNIATGAKLYFDNIKVNGKVKQDYIPVKNDKIQNIKL